MSKPFSEMSDAELVASAPRPIMEAGFGQGAIAELQRRSTDELRNLKTAIQALDTNIQRNAAVTEQQTKALIALSVVLAAFAAVQIVLMLMGPR